MSTIYSKDLRGEESTITVEDDALEARKRRAVPTKRGLYPHELLLLYFAPTFFSEKSLNHFPAAWREAYTLKYPQEVLHSLEKRGFLEPAPALTCLKALPLPELREAARGIKQQFLKIIQSHINMIILYKIRTI